jgi:SAM-dependent methyltransferase
VSTRARTSALDFERLYAREGDPWRLATSSYERRKRSATIAALPPWRAARCLHVGCSTGLLSARLARACEQLVACDFAPFAVAAARARLAARQNVEVRLARFPEDLEPHGFDLIVCAEVLYYLDAATLERAIVWFRAALCAGASVLAVHWRGSGATEPLRGDDVHDRLADSLARWHALARPRRSYRLDRFDGASARGGQLSANRRRARAAAGRAAR